MNRIALVPHDIVDVPHTHAPDARCSTPQVLDEVRSLLHQGIVIVALLMHHLLLLAGKGSAERACVSPSAAC